MSYVRKLIDPVSIRNTDTFGWAPEYSGRIGVTVGIAVIGCIDASRNFPQEKFIAD